jgi:hypothetical protein
MTDQRYSRTLQLARGCRALLYAVQVLRSIGAIIVPVGANVSGLVRWVKRTHRNTVHVPIAAGAGSAAALIRQVAGAMGLPETPRWQAAEGIREYAAKRSGMLLVVSGVERLDRSGMEALRGIYDGARGDRDVPMLLLGAPTFLQALRRTRNGDRSIVSQQLSTRLHPVLSLHDCGPGIGLQDVCLVLSNDREPMDRSDALRWMNDANGRRGVGSGRGASGDGRRGA